MNILKLHPWDISPEKAIKVQKELAKKVVKEGGPESASLVAGVDLSPPDKRGVAKGAVVLLNYPSLEIAEVRVKEGKISFPYIPGLLAFRELPLLVEVFEEIKMVPDLVLVDGQGIAHPRRLGIASHLGLLSDLPTIGCAKSRLTGRHEPVPDSPGKFSYLRDGGEIIGAVLRTRQGFKPIYISIGHKISLDASIRWVISLCRGNRLPEPIRLAHLACSGKPPPPKII